MPERYVEKGKIMKNVDIIMKRTRNLRYISLMISIVFVGAGYVLESFNILCMSMMFLLIHNIIYALENMKERVLFFIFHVTLFTFIISRPFIGMCRGEIWWESIEQGKQNIYFVINVILISMLMLYAGAKLSTYILKEKNQRKNMILYRKKVLEKIYKLCR